MLFKSTLLTAALLAVAGIDARSLDHHNQARQSGPTVYLAGDSTMANTPSPHQGKKIKLFPPEHRVLLNVLLC